MIEVDGMGDSMLKRRLSVGCMLRELMTGIGMIISKEPKIIAINPLYSIATTWCCLAGLHSAVWAWPLCPPQLHLFLGEIKQLAAGWALAFLSQPHITRQPSNSRKLYKCAFDFKFNIGPIENKLRWSGGIHLPKVFTGINIVLSLKTSKIPHKVHWLNIDFRRYLVDK